MQQDPEYSAGEPRTRRRFAAESLSALAASCLTAGQMSGLAAEPSAVALPRRSTGVLASYAQAEDPATRCEPVLHGDFAGGRWRTCRLVSQSWRGTEWTHELSIYCPAECQAGSRATAARKMLLWIDGGSNSKVPAAGGAGGPSDAVQTLAAFANAAAMPAAVVRQVPSQPMFDGLVEDDLIAHSFVEYVRTGDASWPLLLPMVKSAVEAMTAAAALADDHWNLDIDGFLVTGASKRGWTTWLTAAVDDRVAGALPMVIDMLSLERHVQLQFDSFGGMSEQLEDYTSRGIEKLLLTPRGRELIGIVDPYSYRAQLLQPKLIALGTNDPYWPLESLDLYLGGLNGPRWVSYAPNAGHGLPLDRVAGLVAAFGRHVAGAKPLPELRWEYSRREAEAECVVESNEPLEQVVLWQATSPSRDFRRARWSSTPVDVSANTAATAGGSAVTARVTVPRPAAGFAAALVECHFAREPVPLVLTTSVAVQSEA